LSIYVIYIYIYIDALSYRCWLKTLAAFISNPCPKNIPWAYVVQDRVDCLALL
jgi:hypothetical protein